MALENVTEPPPLVGDSEHSLDIERRPLQKPSMDEEEIDLEEGEIIDSGSENEAQEANSNNTEMKSTSVTTSDNKIDREAPTIENHMEVDPSMAEENGKLLEEVSRKRKLPPFKPKKGKKKKTKVYKNFKEELDGYLEAKQGINNSDKDDSSDDSDDSDNPKKYRRVDRRNKKQFRGYKENFQICKFFQEGKCAKGNDCTFSHSGIPSKRKELCKFYLTGYCCKGNNCTYMHEDFPCKFFHTGAKCYSDENCRFSHVPLDEDMQKVLNRYLRNDRGNEPKDSSPPRHESPSKRPSLLGSPPRHVKDAAGPWQQEMYQIQKNKGRSSSFGSSRNMQRQPNFYVEAMRSPPRKRSSPQHRDSMEEENTPPYYNDEDSGSGWNPNDDEPFHGSDYNEKSTSQKPPIWAGDVDMRELYKPLAQMQKETVQVDSIQSQNQNEELQDTSSSKIPEHLPQKQKELYLRIQSHQKELKDEEAKPASPNAGETNWYSSDDEEFTDNHLAESLKKIQSIIPPAAPIPQGPSLNMLPSLNTMFQNNRPNGIESNDQNAIWNVLAALQQPLPPAIHKPSHQALLPTPSTNQFIPPITNLPFQRTPSFPSGDQDFRSPDFGMPPSFIREEVPTPLIAPRDPRLNRDPRNRDPRQQLPDMTVAPPALPPVPMPSLNEPPPKPKEIVIDPHLIVQGGKGGANVPYKLTEADRLNLNYHSYVIEAANMMEECKDPRLLKRMCEMPKNLLPPSNTLPTSPLEQTPKIKEIWSQLNKYPPVSKDPKLAHIFNARADPRLHKREQVTPLPLVPSNPIKQPPSPPSPPKNNFKPHIPPQIDVNETKPLNINNPIRKIKKIDPSRKVNMEYTSPLMTPYEEVKPSSYNSYNKRPSMSSLPIRSTTPPLIMPTLPLQPLQDLQPDFSPPSYLETDVSLKDRFKTIDPTASPFC